MFIKRKKFNYLSKTFIQLTHFNKNLKYFYGLHVYQNVENTVFQHMILHKLIKIKYTKCGVHTYCIQGKVLIVKRCYILKRVRGPLLMRSLQ